VHLTYASISPQRPHRSQEPASGPPAAAPRAPRTPEPWSVTAACAATAASPSTKNSAAAPRWTFSARSSGAN